MKQSTLSFALYMAFSVVTVSSTLVTSILLTSPVAQAAQTNQQIETIEKKTRKTPALRERVYAQLARAQKLADEGDVAKGLAVLDSVRNKADTMNSYERAMMWNFYGFIYYNQQDYKSAVDYFDKLVNENNIPESLEVNTLFSLAQLEMMQGHFAKTIAYIERWEALQTDEANSKGLILKAQAYYQAKDYQAALPNINKVIALEEQSGNTAKENWLVLQRALYYSLQQPLQVTNVLEKMVKLYNKPEYWTQLAAMYGETEQPKKQLAVMEAAYQQGFVTKATDIKSLAQLYFYSGAPAKAAKVLTYAIDSLAVQPDLKTLQFLAQAWSSAKEHEKALPVLQQAAILSDAGNIEQRMGEIYFEMDDYHHAIKMINQALAKGKLDNPGNAYLVLGMAHFNLGHYDNAIAQFEDAKDEQEVASSAVQWLQYTLKEKARTAQL